MIEQPEILKDDADAAAQHGQLAARMRDIAVEHADIAACGLQRHQQQAQERGFTGTGRAGQKLERTLGNVEGHVPQDFGAHAVTQPDIFEMDQRTSSLFVSWWFANRWRVRPGCAV